MLLGVWRRITHHAGIATAIEPAMSKLRAQDIQPTCERGDLLAVLPDTGLMVADVSAVYPAAGNYRRQASATDGAAAATRNQEKRTKYEVGAHRAPLGFTPLTTETYGRMRAPAHAFLQKLASAAASSALAGSEVTTSAFKAGALRELGVALVQGNELVYREAMCLYVTAGVTAAMAGAAVPTAEVEV
jgi:hypothetical protein